MFPPLPNTGVVEMLALLVSVAIAGFAAGIVFARRLTGSIREPIGVLVDQVNRMSQLDFGAGRPIRSSIADITELARAVEAMRLALAPIARFVPRRPVEALRDAGHVLQPGGETREATILFADLEDVSGLAGKLSPHELMLRVSGYLQEVSQAVTDHRGIVDKYVGHAVMALWNAPSDTPDHVALACRAALIARSNLAASGILGAGQGRQPIALRVGLHTDRVTAGILGTSEHLSYTALGGGVNIAARLESVNKGYGTAICISQAIRDQVKDRFLMRPLDVVAVKGRQEAIGIYELIGFLPDVVDGEAADVQSPGMEPFVVPELVATPLQMMKARLTEQAFMRWRAGDMAAAGRAYGKLAQTFPGDRVAELYIKRCAIASSTVRHADIDADDVDSKCFPSDDKFATEREILVRRG